MFVDMYVAIKSYLESYCFHVFSNWKVNSEEELRIRWQNEPLGSVACYSVGYMVAACWFCGGAENSEVKHLWKKHNKMRDLYRVCAPNWQTSCKKKKKGKSN